jgi:hypothetical protein
MNRTLYLLATAALAASPLAAPAQSVADSVAVGAQYRDQIFYSLEHGVARTEALAGWDIAFELTGYTASILTNGGAGVELYQVPGKTVDNWAGALDTTGLSGWSRYDNSTATWSSGAFNMGHDASTGDFGWGEYNMVTHVVSGTALYVIRLVDGSWRKIMIEGLTSGTYTFRTANLDGSSEKSGAVSKSSYVGKHFAYYSLVNDAALDREPNVDQWDLLFGKYVTMLDAGNGTIPYGVTGVLANSGVQVAEVKSANAAAEPAPSDSAAYTDSTARIGYDWKSFTGSSYVVSDSVVYFVKSVGGGLYRLRFTGFSGSSTGVFRFEKTQLAVASVKREDAVVARFAIYPNVIGRHGTFTLVSGLEEVSADARFDLYDLTGACVRSIELGPETGLRRQPVQVDLPAGTYVATMTANGLRASRRLIVQ